MKSATAEISTVRRGNGMDRQLRAFHEAGHLVAIWRLKLPVPEASLTRPFCPPNLQTLTKVEGISRADLLEREILILMAGVAAEAYLTQDEDWWGAHEDRQAAERLIADLLEVHGAPVPSDEQEVGLLAERPETPHALTWRLFAFRTQRLMGVAPIRSAVTAVAHELLSRGMLSTAEVGKVIRQGVASADPDLLMG